MLSLPRFLKILYVDLNRCAAVLCHFVINYYFILFKINLSSTALWLLCLTALPLPSEGILGSGKEFRHIVNKKKHLVKMSLLPELVTADDKTFMHTRFSDGVL